MSFFGVSFYCSFMMELLARKMPSAPFVIKTKQTLEFIVVLIIITPVVIESCIDRLPTNSAPCPDGICPKLLKMPKPAIRNILAVLLQQFIDTGCVPNDWKEARVIPIFKSGDLSHSSNYNLFLQLARVANS